MADVTPSSLPEIDAVEIVNLRHSRADRADHYIAAGKDSAVVRLKGGDAQRVAALWRALPPGEQMRCHVPPFGLRFYAGDSLVCEASICWQCNNIFGRSDGNKVFFEFNGSARKSRELLSECEKALGEKATDDG